VIYNFLFTPGVPCLSMSAYRSDSSIFEIRDMT